MSTCNIRVVCRFRPINANEKKAENSLSTEASLQFPQDNQIYVKVDKKTGAKDYNFAFDKVIPHDSGQTQEQIYNTVAKETINDILDGYNGTILAYGQTGTGKSYTMFGQSVADKVSKGIIPRACTQLFEYIAKDVSKSVFEIKCSFLEIYKEMVKDLLNPSKNSLRVRESPSKGVWVEGLMEKYVTCEEDVLELLKIGEQLRSVSSTKMNEVSSRSHSLFMLTLIQKLPDGSTKRGTLNLADLAGSERVSKTGASGETLEEAKQISKSLHALGNCINALTKQSAPGKNHIPYRDSQLTHILRESLGGNCKTTLVLTCSPHVYNLEETISTLKFGMRAKTIKNSVKVNKQLSVEQLTRIIKSLEKEIEALKKYVKLLEGEIARLRNAGCPQDGNWDLEAWRDEVLENLELTSQEDKAKEEIKNPRQLKRNVSSIMGFSSLEAQAELEKLKEEAEAQINDLTQDLHDLKVEAEQIHEQAKFWREQAKEKDTKMETLTMEIERLNGQLVQKQNKMDYESQQQQLEASKYARKLAEMEKANEELKSQLQARSDAMQSQTPQEGEQQQKKLIEVGHKLSQALEEISSRDNQLVQKDSRIAQQEAELENLTNQLQQLEQKYAAGVKQYMEMERKFKEQLEYYEVTARPAADSRARAPTSNNIVQPVTKTIILVDPSCSNQLVPLRLGDASKRLTTPNLQEKKGYLTKQGGIIKHWQKRWFVLKFDGNLNYYKDETELKGQIPLEGCGMDIAFHETGKPFTFGIFHMNKHRIYYLQARNEAEMNSWMESINSILCQLNARRRTFSFS